VRRLAVSLALVASAVAGLLAAAALAGTSPVALMTTGTTTGSEPPTTGTTTTSPTTPEPPPLIAPGVRVGAVAVGGLTPAEALAEVREAFAAPLPVVVAGRRLAPRPTAFGAIAYAKPAVERARSAQSGAVVPMLVRVRGQLVRAYVARLAIRFDRRPADSVLRLRNLRPFITKERLGRRLDRPAATRAIVGRLLRHNRASLRLRLRSVRPAVTRASFGSIVVIRRGSKTLNLYRGMTLRRVFGVATGTSSYPTPVGRFTIVTMQRNPWWYPPDSDWAQDLEPVPPGPGNPLGTRWMGISSPGVGIHGTPDAASIGYSASHGCIRMRISEAEQLFRLVSVGTPVFIVGA
jgi:lipoprotein-anchoring transpeptidase ErfK/SrfK